MTIFCTGTKREIAKLRGKGYIASLKESSRIRSSRPATSIKVDYHIEENGVLFDLPAMCERTSEQKPGCLKLVEWNNVDLVIRIGSTDLIVTS